MSVAEVGITRRAVERTTRGEQVRELGEPLDVREVPDIPLQDGAGVARKPGIPPTAGAFNRRREASPEDALDDIVLAAECRTTWSRSVAEQPI